MNEFIDMGLVLLLLGFTWVTTSVYAVLIGLRGFSGVFVLFGCVFASRAFTLDDINRSRQIIEALGILNVSHVAGAMSQWRWVEAQVLRHERAHTGSVPLQRWPNYSNLNKAVLAKRLSEIDAAPKLRWLLEKNPASRLVLRYVRRAVA